MAKIKAYTTIEQSRKLAEFMPLESADMYYDRGGLPSLIDKYVTHESIKNDKYQHLIPCWSLAVLLDVIKEQGLVDLRFLQSTYDNRGNHLTNVWCCTFENLDTISLDLYADNPVDACVDMIEKLHELNLL